MSKEFNFTYNKDWLLPFLEDFKKQNDIDDIENFAIKNVEKMFNIKKNKVLSIFSMFSKPEPIDSVDKKRWKDCAQSLKDEIERNGCRNSTGFDGKIVPKNVEFNEKADKNNLDKAERSYKYLKYSHDIQSVLTTSMSDYAGKRPEDVVLHKYRLIDYLREKKVEDYATNYKNWIDILIFVYKLDQEEDLIKIINKFSQINDDNKYVVLKINAGVEFNGNINTDLRNGVDKLTEGEATTKSVKIPNNISFFTGGLSNGGKSKKKTRKSKRKPKRDRKSNKSKRKNKKTRSKRQR